MDREKYLSKDEALQLLKYSRKMKTRSVFYRRAWIILETLLNTGARASEVRKIRVGDLNLNGEPSIFIRNGKGGKQRTIEISQNLKKSLKKFTNWKIRNKESVDPESYLFTNQRKTFYSLCGIQGLFKRMSFEAGLRSCYSIHSTRHTFGFLVYGKSKNIRLTQQMLGHRSLSSTQIYAHVDPEHIKQTVNSLWN